MCPVPAFVHVEGVAGEGGEPPAASSTGDADGPTRRRLSRTRACSTTRGVCASAWRAGPGSAVSRVGLEGAASVGWQSAGARRRRGTPRTGHVLSYRRGRHGRSGAGGSMSWPNGTPRAFAIAQRISMFGLTRPASSCDRVDFATPAATASSDRSPRASSNVTRCHRRGHAGGARHVGDHQTCEVRTVGDGWSSAVRL